MQTVVITQYEPSLNVHGRILSAEDLGYVNDRVLGELKEDVSSFPYTIFFEGGVERRLSPSMGKALRSWKEASDRLGRPLWIVTHHEWLARLAGEYGIGVLEPAGSRNTEATRPRKNGERLDLELPEPESQTPVGNIHTVSQPFLRLRGGIASQADTENVMGWYVRRFLGDKEAPELGVVSGNVLYVSFDDVAVHQEALGLLKVALLQLSDNAYLKGWALTIIAGPDVAAVAREAGGMSVLVITSVPRAKPVSQPDPSLPLLDAEEEVDEPEPVPAQVEPAQEAPRGSLEQQHQELRGKWTQVQAPQRP